MSEGGLAAGGEGGMMNMAPPSNAAGSAASSGGSGPDVAMASKVPSKTGQTAAELAAALVHRNVGNRC